MKSGVQAISPEIRNINKYYHENITFKSKDSETCSDRKVISNIFHVSMPTISII